MRAIGEKKDLLANAKNETNVHKSCGNDKGWETKHTECTQSVRLINCEKKFYHPLRDYCADVSVFA